MFLSVLRWNNSTEQDSSETIRWSSSIRRKVPLAEQFAGTVPFAEHFFETVSFAEHFPGKAPFAELFARTVPFAE